MSWVETAIGAGLGVAGGIYSASQANRFAERMSSTAHQREVADLRKAGLNPMLSVNRGASSPQGAQPDIAGGAQRGASTAMAVKMQRANLALLEAQTALAGEQSVTEGSKQSLNYAESQRIVNMMPSEVELAKMSVEQKKQLYPLALDQAKAEIRSTVASARQAEVMTSLEELLQPGRFNEAEFEKRIGVMGPATRMLLNIVRSVGPSALGAAVLSRGVKTRREEAPVRRGRTIMQGPDDLEN